MKTITLLLFMAVATSAAHINANKVVKDTLTPVSYTQTSCTDHMCSQSCSTTTTPINQCELADNGGSVSATCNQAIVTISHYYTVTDCSLYPQNTIYSTNQCALQPDGTYSTYVCDYTANNVTTNAPPIPASSTATPATYSQSICYDAGCSLGCELQTYPQNTCMLSPDGSGSSFAGVCGSDSALVLTQYHSSSNCAGYGVVSRVEANSCGQYTANTYVQYNCPMAPVPTTQVYSTLTCQDNACQTGCEVQTYYTNACQMTSTGSIKVYCNATTVEIDSYPNTFCGDLGEANFYPTGQCVLNDSGTYTEYFCGYPAA